MNGYILENSFWRHLARLQSKQLMPFIACPSEVAGQRQDFDNVRIAPVLGTLANELNSMCKEIQHFPKRN